MKQLKPKNKFSKKKVNSAFAPMLARERNELNTSIFIKSYFGKRLKRNERF